MLLALAAAGAARAEEPYPTRPMRLVVGFGAGGPTDIPARFVADKLGEALGQRVIVENKPAAAGMIATRDVLSQPRDGYTLLLCTHFEPINTAVYKNVQFKLERSRADLAHRQILLRPRARERRSRPTDFEAFVQYAKAHPGEVTYATIGAGSAQEILARQLEKLTGIAMNRIPFRGGPQVVQELVAGRVHFYVSPTLAIVPQYQAKQLKILAVTAPERLKNLSDIPDPDREGRRLRALRLARRLRRRRHAAADRRRCCSRQIVTIVATPDYREMIEKAGSIAVSSTPDELQQSDHADAGRASRPASANSACSRSNDGANMHGRASSHYVARVERSDIRVPDFAGAQSGLRVLNRKRTRAITIAIREENHEQRAR